MTMTQVERRPPALMKFRVIIQPPAKLDIEAAYLYLREFSPQAADKWLDGIETAIRSLELWPRRFGLARESREFPEGIRQLITASARAATGSST